MKEGVTKSKSDSNSKSSRESLEFDKIDELLNAFDDVKGSQTTQPENNSSSDITKIDLSKGKSEWIFRPDVTEKNVDDRSKEKKGIANPREDKEADLISKTVSTVLKNTTEENELPTGRTKSEERNPLTTVDPIVNIGKSVHSRWYIKGLKNRNPIQFRLAAFFFTATVVLFSVSFLSFGVIAITKLSPNIVLYSLFVGLLICGLLTLKFMGNTRCVVCAQKQMSPKSCHKHQRAHKLPVIGTMFPTMWHGWLFKWFRCRFCGTANRLKG